MCGGRTECTRRGKKAGETRVPPDLGRQGTWGVSQEVTLEQRPEAVWERATWPPVGGAFCIEGARINFIPARRTLRASWQLCPCASKTLCRNRVSGRSSPLHGTCVLIPEEGALPPSRHLEMPSAAKGAWGPGNRSSPAASLSAAGAEATWWLRSPPLTRKRRRTHTSRWESI